MFLKIMDFIQGQSAWSEPLLLVFSWICRQYTTFCFCLVPSSFVRSIIQRPSSRCCPLLRYPLSHLLDIFLWSGFRFTWYGKGCCILFYLDCCF